MYKLYGDPLNPYADIESVAKMHCLLKPRGEHTVYIS